MLKQHAHNMFSFHHRLKFRALPCAPLELSPGPLSRQDVNGSQLSSLWLSVAICGWDGNDHPHSARYLEYPRLKDARIYFVELDARILQVPGFLDSG